jgi:hypothetical protein
MATASVAELKSLPPTPIILQPKETMITRHVALLALFFVAAESLKGAPDPTVESRGAFIKISSGPGSVDIPAELNPPQLLFVRKSSILQISVTYVARNTDFETAITVYGGVMAPRLNAPVQAPATATVDTLKTYYYHFTTLANAGRFCEAVLANQEG